MKSSISWLAITVATVFVAIVLGFAVTSWGGDAAELSIAGWLAMTLGIVVTLAVGIGLMVLVFYSNRHGYDEPGRDRR